MKDRQIRGVRFGPELGRRDFLTALGGGLVVFAVPAEAWALQGRGGEGLPRRISAWLHIDENGSVRVFTGKVEVGQNIRTSLAQVVAEELRVPLASLELVMGDTELTPYDRGTFGSRTTPDMAANLRRVAASARVMLVEQAALKWGVDPNSVSVRDGAVVHEASGRRLGFGEITRGEELVGQVRESARSTPPLTWTLAGTSVPKVNGRAFVTGEHRYTFDLSRPGMLIGKVVRPDSFGSRLESVDVTRAEAVPGVVVVREGEFIGVAAPDEATALRALGSVKAAWKGAGQPSHGEIYEYLREHPAEARGWPRREPYRRGSVEEGLSAARQTLQSEYRVAYIAHAPLEPRGALAEWKGGKLTVWTSTQRPFGVRSELAREFGQPENRVRVLMPDAGSAYGGKHSGEAALEAARLARAAGKPVRVQWTREEEFNWAYFRPAGVIDVRSGVDRQGRLTAWEFHNINSGSSAIRTPYQVPHQHIEYHAADSPLRQGSYRALAATANHFAREVHMDELATAIGIDPLQFRLANLKDERLGAVLKAAAESFGWKKSPAGRGFGIAGGFVKGGYVAACAEVTVGRGGMRVVRVVEAFECGAILNPDQLSNQVEGCIVQGLGGALFERIEFEKGRILNGRFAQYRLPRFADMPRIEVVLLNRPDLPSAGAGEAPIVAVAPALGNAIFDATGVRLRSLPLVPDGRVGERA